MQITSDSDVPVNLSKLRSMAAEPGQEQQNGYVEFNPDAVDEDEQNKFRPPDIDADVRDMERRKRVEAMMGSRMFRDELECIVEHQLKEGYGNAAVALQQLSDMMGLPAGVRGGTGGSWSAVLRGGTCVLPISDIRGVENLAFGKGEKSLRCKLAALYRLVDMFGWTESIYNHITVRMNQDQEHFLINPFGLMYHEVTASSLVKVDMQGHIIEPGSTNFGVNVAGFMLHSAIHAARPDVKCVVHVHLPDVVAVSAMKCGLLPLSQNSLIIGDVSYHDYHGILVDPTERELIGRNLGPRNKVMLLRNHGMVACGETIEEAFILTMYTVSACEMQVKMMPMGIENLVLVSDDAKRRTQECVKKGGGGVNSKTEGIKLDDSVTEEGKKEEVATKREKKWKTGELEFEAYMRVLDNAGYRTGHNYRQALVKNEPPRQKNDVEVPPAVSSFGYMIEEDELYKNSPLRKYLEGKRGGDKSRWINSPNVYQKVEVLETGSPDPRKITKWVPDGSPTHSTPVKLESVHQFVPLNTNSKEFKAKQKSIKENRRLGGVSAGPQSQILEGATWDQAKALQDAQMSVSGDHVVMMGAASKGIIQREFQLHANVYKAAYAKNPFDGVSDQELEEYKRTVDRKLKGEPEDQPGRFDEEVIVSRGPEVEPLMAEPVTLPPMSPKKNLALSPASPTPPKSPTSDNEADAEEEVSRTTTPSRQMLTVETRNVPTAERVERHVLPEDDSTRTPDTSIERSASTRLPRKGTSDSWYKRRSWSLGRDKRRSKGGDTVNGDDIDNPHSTISQSSRDESSARDVSEDSPKKDQKKKKSGLRTPSFLKKKKDKKKPVEA